MQDTTSAVAAAAETAPLSKKVAPEDVPEATEQHGDDVSAETNSEDRDDDNDDNDNDGEDDEVRADDNDNGDDGEDGKRWKAMCRNSVRLFIYRSVYQLI